MELMHFHRSNPWNVEKVLEEKPLRLVGSFFSIDQGSLPVWVSSSVEMHTVTPG